MIKRTYTREQKDKRNERARAWRTRQSREKLQARERVYTLRYGYGLTPEQYEEMFEVQGGVCAICKQPPKDNGKRRLVVDHDHKTKRNRGLLCPPCNVALNGIERVPDWSTKAAQYLTGSKEIN